MPSDATDEEKLGTYEYAFAKMSYLDSILSTNIANNPHVGYGNYDDGNTFIEYMKLPFKYLIDNKNIQNSILDALAGCYKFDDITKSENKINDKIQIMNSRQPNGEGLTDFVRYEYPKNDDNFYKLVTEYGLKEDKYNLEKRWFINTKVLTIEKINKNEPLQSYKVVLPIMDGKKVKYPQGRILVEEEWGELSKEDKLKCVELYLFDEYFKTIIMPYVMQVIPSTTILKLKNFSA